MTVELVFERSGAEELRLAFHEAGVLPESHSTEVDTRVRALVDPVALRGAAGRWPDAKIDTDIARDAEVAAAVASVKHTLSVVVGVDGEDRAVVAGDKGTLFAVTAGASNRTVTLPELQAGNAGFTVAVSKLDAAAGEVRVQDHDANAVATLDTRGQAVLYVWGGAAWIRAADTGFGGADAPDLSAYATLVQARFGIFEQASRDDESFLDTIRLNVTAGVTVAGDKWYITGANQTLKGKIVRYNGTALPAGDLGSADVNDYFDVIASNETAETEFNADAIESLESKTADLHAGEIVPTGWQDAEAADGGLDRGPSGNTRPTQTYARAVSEWTQQVPRHGGYLVARIRSTLAPAQARVRYISKPTSSGRILRQTFVLSSWRKIGESADGTWTYYTNPALTGEAVATFSLETTADTEHVGTSRFSGIFDGTIKDGLVDGDALAPSLKTKYDNAAADASSALTKANEALVENDTQDATIAGKVSKSGDTMTGKLTLDGAPTADLHAATKKYVDDNSGGGDGTGVSGELIEHHKDSSPPSYTPDTWRNITLMSAPKRTSILSVRVLRARGTISSASLYGWEFLDAPVFSGTASDTSLGSGEVAIAKFIAAPGVTTIAPGTTVRNVFIARGNADGTQMRVLFSNTAFRDARIAVDELVITGATTGGLADVSTDSTLTGDGTSSDPLKVANPFTDDDETKLDGIAAGADVSPDKALNTDVDSESDDTKYTTVAKVFRAIARKVKNASTTVRGIVLIARNEDVDATETDTTRTTTVATAKRLVARIVTTPLTAVLDGVKAAVQDIIVGDVVDHNWQDVNGDGSEGGVGENHDTTNLAARATTYHSPSFSDGNTDNFVLLRIPVASDVRHYQFTISGVQGAFGANLLHALGQSADGTWKYYGYPNAELNAFVGATHTVTLQISDRVLAHTTYDGQLGPLAKASLNDVLTNPVVSDDMEELSFTTTGGDVVTVDLQPEPQGAQKESIAFDALGNSPAGVHELTPDGTITVVNGDEQEILEYTSTDGNDFTVEAGTYVGDWAGLVSSTGTNNEVSFRIRDAADDSTVAESARTFLRSAALNAPLQKVVFFTVATDTKVNAAAVVATGAGSRRVSVAAGSTFTLARIASFRVQQEDPQELYETLAAEDMQSADFVPYLRQTHSDSTQWATQARTGALTARGHVLYAGTPSRGAIYGGRDGDGSNVLADLHVWELTDDGITITKPVIHDDGRNGISAPLRPPAMFSGGMIANDDLSRILIFPGANFRTGTLNIETTTQIWGLERRSDGSYDARKFTQSGDNFAGREGIGVAGTTDRGVMGYGQTGSNSYRDELYSYHVTWGTSYTLAIDELTPSGDQPSHRSGIVFVGQSHHVQHETVDGLIGFGWDGTSRHGDIYRFHADLVAGTVQYYELDRSGATVAARSLAAADGDGANGVLGYGHDGRNDRRDVYRYSVTGNDITFSPLGLSGAPAGRTEPILVGDQHFGLVGTGQGATFRHDFATYRAGTTQWERKRLTADYIQRVAKAAVDAYPGGQRQTLLWSAEERADSFHPTGLQLPSGLNQKIFGPIRSTTGTPWVRFELELRWQERHSGTDYHHYGIITFPSWRQGSETDDINVYLHGQGRFGGVGNTSTLNAIFNLGQPSTFNSQTGRLFVENFNPSDTGIVAATMITIRLWGIR